MSDSVRPQRRQPTRLSHPWDSPGKNTGVGCHFLLQCMKVKRESEVAQSCLTLRPHGLQPIRLLRPWDFPGKSTGVDCHFLLQETFPTQGSNLHFLPLLHCPNHPSKALPPNTKALGIRALTYDLGSWNKQQYNNTASPDPPQKILHAGPVHKSTTPESHWQTETIRLTPKSLSASLFPFSHQDRDTW